MASIKELWIEVFKAGTHTDASGNTRDWTTEDLDNIVNLYNNQNPEDKHEAPVVIGHPEDDSPAYGWVDSLKRDGEVLLAKLTQLAPAFVEWVKQGLYKKRSISLYADLMLKHIGFLGGVPPAVKGMADPAFKSGTESILFEFAESNNEEEPDTTGSAISNEFQELDQLIKIHQEERSQRYKIGIKPIGHKLKPTQYEDLDDEDFADPVHYRFPIGKKFIAASLANWSKSAIRKLYSSSEQEIIKTRILNAASRHGVKVKSNKYNEQKNGVNFMTEEQYNALATALLAFLSETFGEEVANQTGAWLDEQKDGYLVSPTEDSPAPTEAPVAASESEESIAHNELVKNLQIEIEQLKAENRTKDFKAYVENLTSKEGKLVPAQHSLAMTLLEMGHKSGKVQFSEAKNKEMEGVEAVKRFMESYEKLVDTNPIEAPEPQTEVSNDFAGLNVDEERLELDKKIREYQVSQSGNGTTVSYAEALNFVINNME